MKTLRKVRFTCCRGMLVLCGILSGVMLRAQSFSNPRSFTSASTNTPDYSGLLGFDSVTLLCLGAGVIWFMLMASVSVMARGEIKHPGR